MMNYYEISVTTNDTLTTQQEEELRNLLADYFDFSEPGEKVHIDLVDAD